MGMHIEHLLWLIINTWQVIGEVAMVNVYYLYLSHPGPSSWSKEAMGPAEASGLWVEVSAHCPLCTKGVLGWETGALGSCPGSSHSVLGRFPLALHS